MPIYLCIDLKSFYASVECVDRGYDPFKVKLVVADPTRGDGAITLAISPAMKALGVKNRCRIYEIPKDIEYITAMPRMKRYMEMSAKIYGIYLDYFSSDDIHVYSIDEVFIDITHYLNLYRKNPKEIAQMVTKEVYERTGICATCGIGSNLYLAKIAMDIISKHVETHIGILNEESYKKLLWHHKPLTDFWNFGRGISNRLAKFGAYDMYSITKIDERLLYKEFGINAEFIIDHAWGRETCTMADIKNYKGEPKSLSNSQILFKDYNCEDAWTCTLEMIDNLVLELIENKLYTECIHLYIGYSKNIINSTGGQHKMDAPTCSFKKIREEFKKFYWKTVKIGYPIRQIGISLQNLTYEPCLTLSLFNDESFEENEECVQNTVLDIKDKYGKNAILRGFYYLQNATGINRNLMVGGHKA